MEEIYMKLEKILSFKGKVICKTGLHIGGTNNQIKIGGVDSEVIRNPLTDEPYIPGSSLKGKMRSQLEKKLGKVTDNGRPCNCGQIGCTVCTLFGAHMNTKSLCGSTRIIVRDCNLTEETRQKYHELIKEKGASYLETKAENIINRKSGTSDNPRFVERIPAGSEFEFNIQLNVFDDDDEKELVDAVKECLKLVEDSYLGGSGSRGYGQVEFKYIDPLTNDKI
jgi:CRISPR-associated protein Csm3